MSNVQFERIAIFVPTLQGGGAERVAVILANEIAKRGLCVDLVASNADGPYRQNVSPSVRVVDLSASRVLASIPKLVRYIKLDRPTAIISVMTHANVVIYLAAKLARRKPIILISEHSMFFTTDNNSDIKSMIIRLLMRPIYTRCHHIVAVSNDLANGLAHRLKLPRNRIQTIYNPVFTDELVSKSLEPVPELPHVGRPIILAVGRLVEHKDYPTLLRAFAELRKKRPASLVILGTGAGKSQLLTLISDLNLDGDVQLPGFVENPYAWMRHADVLALSSATEAFGNVLVEAMACGTRIVSTDCPGGPKEILDGGKWGRLVPVGDHKAFAEALIQTLDEVEPPQVQLRAAEFSVVRSVDDYLRLIFQSKSK